MRTKIIRGIAFGTIAGLMLLMTLRATVGQDSAKSQNVNKSSADDDPDETLRQRVLEAAKTYKDFGRVDDEARWAPALCRSPMPASARVSQSGDDETHGGNKLYFMFAKDRAAYVNVGLQKVPDIWKDRTATQAGQVIVKESWKPKETDGPIEIKRRYLLSSDERKEIDKYVSEETKGTLPFATHGDKTYYAAEKAALFLMLRAEEDNAYEVENSTQGWIFATTTPDGKEITALGKIESCVGCHQDAPNNGLFGIPGDFTRW